MTTATEADFVRQTETYRRELLVHCYRMLGSTHDAEDLVQETYLRAWRAYGGYDSTRSSLRTWLYRIATNACLTALEQRSRRALPSDLRTATTDPRRAPGRDAPEVPWLEPLPDAWAFDPRADPATVAESREHVRLALIAALQHLPPKQRAVLLLRDVLGLRSAETADLVGISVTAADSTLRRARSRIERHAPTPDDVAHPEDAETRELLRRYVAAFEQADIDALTNLLAQDAVWEMPPVPNWYAGRAAVAGLVSTHWPPTGGRLLPTGANGQPAFGFYVPNNEGGYDAHSLQVLTLTGGMVSRVVAFHSPHLFPSFDLPLTT
jgi:RNA polymerase sigma-70 factor (ECF subfamily)